MILASISSSTSSVYTFFFSILNSVYTPSSFFFPFFISNLSIPSTSSSRLTLSSFLRIFRTAGEISLTLSPNSYTYLAIFSPFDLSICIYANSSSRSPRNVFYYLSIPFFLSTSALLLIFLSSYFTYQSAFAPIPIASPSQECLLWISPNSWYSYARLFS